MDDLTLLPPEDLTLLPPEPTVPGAAATGAAAGGAFVGVGKGLEAGGRYLQRLPVGGRVGALTKTLGGGSEALGRFLSQRPLTTTAGAGVGGGAGQAVRETEMIPEAAPTKNIFGFDIPVREPLAVGAELAGAGATQALRSTPRALYESYLGAPSEVSEKLFYRARQLGFLLDPRMIRQEGKAAVTGFGSEAKRQNQRVSNEIAASATGKKASSVTPEFIGERLDTIGKEFDRLIKNRTFTIDANDQAALAALQFQESTIAPAASAAARNASQSLQKGSIPGNDLQRIRSELARIIRTTNDGNEIYAAGQAIDLIDDIISKNLQQAGGTAAAELEIARSQYRATKTLQLLAKRDGIKDGDVSPSELGNLLSKTDRNYEAGTSTNPLSELGRIGEAYGIRAIWQPQRTGPMIEPGQPLAEGAKRLIKGGAQLAGKAVPGIAVGGLYGGLPGLATTGGILGVEQLAKLLARSRVGQEAQVRLGRVARRPSPGMSGPTAVSTTAADIGNQ